MCKASIEALATRDAQEGDVTILGTSPYALPQLVRRVDGYAMGEATVTCAKTGRKMLISGMVPAVQAILGVSKDATDVVFVEDIGDVPDRIFVLENKRLVDLAEVFWEQNASGGGKITATMLGEMTAEEREEMLAMIAGRDAGDTVSAATEAVAA